MAITPAAQARAHDDFTVTIQTYQAHWHSTRPLDLDGRQLVRFELDTLPGAVVALSLDAASVRLLRTTTAPDYFDHAPGTEAPAHPSRSAPLCKDCRHYVGERSCNAPQAPVHPVDGLSAIAAHRARSEAHSCGADGRWFQPLLAARAERTTRA